MLCGELVDQRCRSPRCPYCGPIEALKLVAAIALAEPERAITLTQVGDVWEQRRRRMFDLRRILARAVGEVEWAWTVEPNPRGTGYHVHALEHGPRPIPQRLLSRAADGAGMGVVTYIQRLDRRSASSLYLVKMAADAYGLKAATSAGEREQFLEANGGRQLVHTSRGFWRDRGEPIVCARPRRVAVQRAMERVHGIATCRHHWSEISDPNVLEPVERVGSRQPPTGSTPPRATCSGL